MCSEPGMCRSYSTLSLGLAILSDSMQPTSPLLTPKLCLILRFTDTYTQRRDNNLTRCHRIVFNDFANEPICVAVHAEEEKRREEEEEEEEEQREEEQEQGEQKQEQEQEKEEQEQEEQQQQEQQEQQEQQQQQEQEYVY